METGNLPPHYLIWKGLQASAKAGYKSNRGLSRRLETLYVGLAEDLSNRLWMGAVRRFPHVGFLGLRRRVIETRPRWVQLESIRLVRLESRATKVAKPTSQRAPVDGLEHQSNTPKGSGRVPYPARTPSSKRRLSPRVDIWIREVDLSLQRRLSLMTAWPLRPRCRLQPPLTHDVQIS